ncbi:ammonia permease (plasmid) [Singulisphaera acidiphila DSM 18658]|uniref:Ammonium transporter n=1 Tax=Singulisphaera acidiphila (strain ATCC BAA-1392 / DSM 18658 / VKM B-2454 / MOB10) TaxID=886293 RepID=L0DQC9_SINAD|nr:ammonium transporter [Singulisphaera acidiphila]AGA31624.1 ammonia permease [Singulisphaera acidiphila DSM 18658]
MKRATPFPFLMLVALAIAALVVKPAHKPTPVGEAINSGDVAWMLTAAALVLLMTPGLSFFYGGMVGFKNVVSTMLQSVVALGVISLLWVLVGFSLAFGDSIGGFVGNPMTFFMFDGVGELTHPDLAPTIPLVMFALFQLKFAIITPALITGSFAERVRFSSYLLFMVLFSLLIYCPLAHMTWHPDGFFRKMGVLDFAGGTVVHMSAGFAALAGALVLGRRKSHLANEAHSPANVPFVLLGTGMLWFGWFGFNAGSALAANGAATMAFGTTNTASAAAMLGWMFFDWMRGHKPSALGACIGAVVGLVAITPAAGFVTIRESIIIGLAASVISNLAVNLRTKSTLDDTLDVFPCHGVGGMVGMVATGIFAANVGLTSGLTKTFFNHLIALVIVAAFSFIGSLILYKVTDLIIPLRVTQEQEDEGLDLSQHGETALGAELLGGAHANGQAHVEMAVGSGV